MPRIDLLPAGRALEAPAGASLRDILFSEGVEFPCGGAGRCGRCRIRTIDGAWPETEIEARLLPPRLRREGWRLACQGVAHGPLILEVAQWEAPILLDDSAFEFTPAEGLGIAIDLGTTTIAAQLIDRRTGHILGVAAAMNAQGAQGPDVMSRLEFALRGGAEALRDVIRKQIGRFVDELLTKSEIPAEALRSVVIVGNTAMHHLFCGLPVEGLACDPFEPATLDPQQFTGEDLGWNPPDVTVSFLSPIGGFVGSDLTAGIIATRLLESKEPVALIDLGTNGEIIVARDGELFCASTAAGPAFEGARIRMGMRGATGAIDAVRLREGAIECHVIGGAKAQGICGSGLVDAIATGLEAGVIEPSGRFHNGIFEWQLAEKVALYQTDIRELQLAKAAISAGALLLLEQAGISVDSLARVYLAGAFGNYVNPDSAARIGLTPFPVEKISPAGNTALLGAKLALFQAGRAQADAALRCARHISLNLLPEFQERFIRQISFRKG